MTNIEIGLLALSLTTLALATHAQEGETQKAEASESADATSAAGESPAANLTAEQKQFYTDLLAEWRENRKRLFSQLAEAVQASDTERAYQVVKQLFSGGTGPHASEAELLRAEAQQKREIVQVLEKDLEELKLVDPKLLNLPEATIREHRERVAAAQAIIDSQNREIEIMEKDAKKKINDALAEALPAIFRIMGDPSQSL